VVVSNIANLPQTISETQRDFTRNIEKIKENIEDTKDAFDGNNLYLDKSFVDMFDFDATLSCTLKN